MPLRRRPPLARLLPVLPDGTVKLRAAWIAVRGWGRMKPVAGAMLFAFGLIGCSGCGNESTPSSDPADAAGIDAPLDATHDARDDARSDAADASDAPVAETGGSGGGLGDASAVGEGEWVRSPFSDFLGCTVEQPKDLSTVTKATWVPCATGDHPCELLDTGYLADNGADTRLSFLAFVRGEPLQLGINRKLRRTSIRQRPIPTQGNPQQLGVSPPTSTAPLFSFA